MGRNSPVNNQRRTKKEKRDQAGGNKLFEEQNLLTEKH